VTEDEKATSYSATLTECLTQHKTAAIAVELMQHPKVALAAVVHGLVLSQFGLDLHLYRSATSIQLSTTQPHLGTVEADTACKNLEQQRKQWIAQFPRSSGALWRWCLERDQDALLSLMAFCAAKSLNAVRAKGESAKCHRLQHADAIATALGMDMMKWFTPTAENFFKKIPKSLMLAAMTEAGKPPTIDAAKLKKAELAEFAERTLRGTGWLPEPLRIRAAQREDDEVGYSLEDPGELSYVGHCST
jgi:ParB family chromosome partitioning protein